MEIDLKNNEISEYTKKIYELNAELEKTDLLSQLKNKNLANDDDEISELIKCHPEYTAMSDNLERI